LGDMDFMTIGSIVDDAIRYPLSDWKRYLILAILFLVDKNHVCYFLTQNLKFNFKKMEG